MFTCVKKLKKKFKGAIICYNFYSIFYIFIYVLFYQTAHREELIKQLIPTIKPLGRINVKLFGHSGVGKTTLISTMKAGYFSGLFRKAKSIQSNTNNAHNTNLSVKIKSEFDVPAKNYLGLNSNNYTYTRGIEVHKVL